ncbi:hypothetical protein TD95_003591 [Thielaviopsis punctulata]|uniref:CobW C-terminal domain-containing protein n=1 Tax=Thielaviopsis punctulata TaxID=72032 RepID=A0A0F4Z8I9_9PEZI|nr:hypothetical protein TD95_003591 [Thielaviopsis punctulata]
MPPVTRQAKRSQSPTKALPVTLLSGFLGSGKTSVLQHILKSNHGLRIAVIVNDIGAVNVDASLISQTHRLSKTEQKVIALQNGCICCTLRGDLLEELVELSKLQAFDYVVIESSGISEPEQVAETFDVRLAEQMAALVAQEGDDSSTEILRVINASGGIDAFARLDTTVTVIDAFTFFNDFATDALLSARRDDVTPEDERTVADLLVDQIEFADVILVNKVDMVDISTKQRVITLIKKLNHRAKIIESSHGKVSVTELVNTGLFDMAAAQTGYGWLQDLHQMTVREINGKKLVTPKPETEEYNVRNFVYTAARPFHPKRLWELVYDKFILQMEFEDEEDEEDEEVEGEEDDDDEMSDADSDLKEDSQNRQTVDTPPSSPPSCSPEKDLVTPSNTTILRTKKAHPLFSRLFRSKGEFFLATRPHRAGEWSQAGAMLTLKGGREWFCTLPESEYMTGDAEIDALVKHDVEKGGEWGDRRQELVFIGEALDVKGLTEVLNAALLTDKEMKKWEVTMRDKRLDEEQRSEKLFDLFEDGFPDWPGSDHDHDHDHKHVPDVEMA